MALLTYRRFIAVLCVGIALHVSLNIIRLIGPSENAVINSAPSDNMIFGGDRADRLPTTTPRSLVPPRPTSPPPLPPYDVEIIRHDPSICARNHNLRWLVYVHSAPRNGGRRMILRQTWANTAAYRESLVTVVFIIGKTRHDSLLEQELAAEFAMHGDLVQGDFIDHYHNMTLKALLALKWVSLYCAGATHVLKADDDTYVDLPWFMTHVQSEIRTMTCVRYVGMQILRRSNKEKSCQKWCVADAILPGTHVYPPYCAGLAFAITADLIAELRAAAKVTPMFWIDDVFITGLALGKVDNVTYVDLTTKYTLKTQSALVRMKTTHEMYRLVHAPNVVVVYRMWSCLLRTRIDEQSKTLLADDAVNKTVPCY